MNDTFLILSALGLLLLAVCAFSSTVRGFLGVCLYLLMLTFAFVLSRSKAVKIFVESNKDLMNVVVLVCTVLLVGAVVYSLVGYSIDKKKGKEIS